MHWKSCFQLDMLDARHHCADLSPKGNDVKATGPVSEARVVPGTKSDCLETVRIFCLCAASQYCCGIADTIGSCVPCQVCMIPCLHVCESSVGVDAL